MHLALTLVAPDPKTIAAAQERAERALPPLSVQVTGRRVLGPGALDIALEAPTVLGAPEVLAAVRARVNEALERLPVDFAVQPAEGRRKALFVADMDSTIIGCECLDELADFAGVKDQVAAITERAMRGEIGFEGALRERVGMLKGLKNTALQQCYDERVRLNPGAFTLVQTMRANGVRCVLVSGGFTFFTGRVAAACGFHADRANRFVEDGGHLAGAVHEPILGREAKLAALREEAARLGVDPSSAIAIGDGANDLAMIEEAGLGVAYRAKPVVAAQADCRIDHADLTALLYFQGYAAEEFAQPSR
ncbi:MAG TPA: phosphoserine phosphatase SerB [Caulobacteraceae bacterium]|jgi:phosphoserine phosphatase